MNLTVKIKAIEGLVDCEYIHSKSNRPLVYGCTSYISFLHQLIPSSRVHILIASAADVPLGYLILFEKNCPLGKPVFNSLPFYGSHGGPICVSSPSIEYNTICSVLLRSAYQLAYKANAASITIVENLFNPLDLSVTSSSDLHIVDRRIGQVSSLPVSASDICSSLMTSFHQKTRNAIRKGQLLDQHIEHVIDDSYVGWLHDVHSQSITALGGIPKSKKVFTQLLSNFPLGTTSRLYIGSLDGNPISGLLLLLYSGTVEYFTPVCINSFRDKQALSALIFHAMAELTADGYQLWNWGGTWPSQKGVYRFKSRFGAADFPYRYFNKIFDPAILKYSQAELNSFYEYFYTFNYNS